MRPEARPIEFTKGRGHFYRKNKVNKQPFINEACCVSLIRPSVCLEVGSGSGVVSAFLASVVGPEALYL